MTDYPKRPRQQRLSVSIPRELAAWVRQEAKANGVTVSLVVETAVRRRMAQDTKP